MLDEVVLAADGQVTVGVTDLQAFAGLVRQDVVLGAATASAIGPVGVHGDATVTFPGPDAVEEEPFVRVVVGGMGRPTGKTTVSAEAYLQTLGSTTYALDAFTNPRFATGEVWLLGRWYATAAVSQELTPLVTGTVAAIANLEDPSALLTATVSWSVADEASLVAGAYYGAGRTPVATTSLLEPPEIRSEFGLYPAVVFLSLRSYF
jgi:hypothetical protein